MPTEFRRTWHALKTARPGYRFKNHYNAAHRSRVAGSNFSGILVVGGGVSLVVIGVVFLVIPGPGLPLIVIGAALLAGKSRRVAVALDWTELKVRRAGVALARAWHNASLLAKSTVIAAAVLISAAAITVAYRMLF